MNPPRISLPQKLARPFRVCLLGTLVISATADARTAGNVASGKLAEAVGPSIAESISLGDRLENLGRLYNNEDNPILQNLWILGRYHGQYHWSDSSHGEDEGYESRRIRVGAQAQLFNHLVLHAQAISGSDFEPVYNGFTELWVRWMFSDAVQLTIGQQKHRFSHDRNVSSR